MQVWPLGRENPLEEGMTTHSGILAWRIPWTEEPRQTVASQASPWGCTESDNNWSDLACMHASGLDSSGNTDRCTEMKGPTTEPSSTPHWTARLTRSWGIRRANYMCCGCVFTQPGPTWIWGDRGQALIHSDLSSPLASATSVRNKDSQGSESVTKTRKIRENRSYPISRLTKEQAVSTLPLNIQGPSPRIWTVDVKKGWRPELVQELPSRVNMDLKLWNPRLKGTRPQTLASFGLYIPDVIEIKAGGVIRKELKCFRHREEEYRIHMGGRGWWVVVEMSLMSPHSRAKGVRLCN